VQSATLFLPAREPDAKFRFDLCSFADTGEETASVYAHLDHLKSLGTPEIWVRSAGKLGDDLVRGRNSTEQRFVSIPAFTTGPAGKVGMVRRQCTSEYKIEVVNKAIRRELLGLKPRQRMPKDIVIHQHFGISTDEAGRAERAKRRFAGVKHSIAHWPLIDMGWSRKDCVEIDAALRDKNSVATRGFPQELFVHRSCTPLPVIDFDSLAPNTLDPMTVGECQGMCGV
jgi:hypothetical protein